MDTDQASTILDAHVREGFGKLLVLRQVHVVRRASGKIWRAELVCPTSNGDIRVGQVAVDEEGQIASSCTVDQLVQALVNAHGAMGQYLDAGRDSVAEADFLFDLGVDQEERVDLPEGDDSPRISVVGQMSEQDIREEIRQLCASGSRQELLAARELLPRLLPTASNRGFVLAEMGEVERRLGESDLALQYLEAAAREFADRSDMRALELVAGLALRMVGEEGYARSAIKQLVDYCRRRLQPVEGLTQSPAFRGMAAEVVQLLEQRAKLSTFREAEVLLKEGSEAVRAFVVKSGIVSVRLEDPAGGTRLVRCCFPGDLIGETSVLGKPGATCNATVQAECLTTLWEFEGRALRELCAREPLLKSRLEAARALHRLDSFFSMNETTQTLDARIRDGILSCVTGLRRAEPDELLNTPNAEPAVVYLIAEGSVDFVPNEGRMRVVGPDSFLGLRDALYRVPMEATVVTREPCLLVAFDPQRLRALAADASAEVVAVIERLG